MPYAGTANGRRRRDMGSEGDMSVGAAGDPLDCFEERLGACFRHLDTSVDRDALEPLLVRLLLVAACGAYEKTIRNGSPCKNG